VARERHVAADDFSTVDENLEVRRRHLKKKERQELLRFSVYSHFRCGRCAEIAFGLDCPPMQAVMRVKLDR
jgi:hypothetical protein